MGQQQLLLIVLGVIIVGIAILIGIDLFQTQSIENKRDVVINESLNIGGLALQYFKKAKTFGGGQYTFVGWTIPVDLDTTTNGVYEATVTALQVDIIGTGNEAVSGNDMVKVKTVVTAGGIKTIVLN
jgi:hypothetical protein